MIHRLSGMLGISLVVAVMAGCVTDQAFSKKNETPTKVQQATERYAKTNQLMTDANRALQSGDPTEARKKYQEILELDPANPQAQNNLRLLNAAEKHRQLILDAQALFKSGNLDGARLKLRPVLIENPGQAEARALMQEIDAKNAKDQITPKKLKPPRNKTVSLEFRDAGLQNVFEVISKTSGINFVFDPTIRPDLKASIFVKDASVEEVIDFLLMMHQLGKKVLTENSLLIYPLNRSSFYDDLVLRTFYLNHADAKQTVTLIKAMLPIKDILIDDKLNMITVKATYEQLKDIEKLIADEDMPDPEVVLDVEVLEVKRSRLTDIGLVFPDQAALVGANTGYLTLTELKSITNDNIRISPAPVLNLLRQDGDTNLLANPRIRVKNREKAKIHIGDKIPIETTTISSSSNFASKSANYLDVGLKLDVEPRVMLNNDVNIKVNLEVSNATLPSGATFPTVNTRNTSTVLMTGDGETQILAGLISDEDRKSAKKVPGLADIPVLGRLFTDQSDDHSKTEVVLLITPHVVRNILRPEANTAEFYGGVNGRTGPINFNPTAILQQFSGVPNTAAQTAQPQAAPAAAPAQQPAQTAPAAPMGGPQPLGKPIGTE